MTDFSTYEFYSSTPEKKDYLKVRFGSGKIEPKGGGAGWEDVARPLRRPLTVWRGAKESYSLKIPSVIDKITDGAHGKSIEEEVRTLEVLAGINVPGDTQPPLLILNGYGALPHDYENAPQNRWFIEEPPEYTDETRRKGDGARVQIFFTVKFKIFTVADELSRASKPKQTRTVRARSGETFQGIAARELKHARWGTRLAQFNGRRDAAQKLHEGQEVKLPNAEQIREWERLPRR
jgi:hypothetical protein